jgi:hypothetical protein
VGGGTAVGGAAVGGGAISWQNRVWVCN